MFDTVQKTLVRLCHRALVALLSHRQDQYLDYWQWRWIGWTSISSPWRMTIDEAAHYRDALREAARAGRPLRVLILGATPALRILAAKEEAEVTCADFSLPMLERMGKFVEHKVRGATMRETWIRGDWLRIPLPQDYFDAVAADMALLFIGRDDRNLFLGRVKESLRLGGRFISRVHVVDATLRARSMQECLTAFFARVAPELRTPQEFNAVLDALLLDWSWNPETGRTERARMAETLAPIIAREADQKRRRSLSLFLKEYRSGIDFCAEPRADTECQLAAYFTIEKRQEAGDYAVPEFARHYPLYILRR